MASREVILHVYDISRGMAGPLGPALLRMELPYGIPHTGVVLDGYEYFFGGGIQKQRPAAVVQSTGLAPIARLPLGRTARSDAEVAEHLRALAPRFSAATYDLFRNNCNHFSAALAAFLGCSVPAEIVQLPERVQASGPLGQQIAGMWGAMSGGGTGDPFAAFGPSSGAGAGAGGAGGAGGGARAAAPAALPAALPPALPPLATYPDATGAELVGPRLRAAAAAAAAAGAPGAALSDAEADLLAALPAALAAPEPAPWAPTACALAARVLADWPPAAAAFPGALLARLLAARGDCAAALTAPRGAAALLLARLAASAEGWGLASANNQALQALASVTAGAQGAAWGTADEAAAPALAAVAARELGNAARSDCRAIALGIAGNLARAWAGVARAGSEAQAGAHVARGGLALLCGLLAGVEGAGVEAGVAARRLACAAALLRAGAFAGGDLGALALSLDAGAGVGVVAGGGGRWEGEARAAAQGVLALLAAHE